MTFSLVASIVYVSGVVPMCVPCGARNTSAPDGSEVSWILICFDAVAPVGDVAAGGVAVGGDTAGGVAVGGDTASGAAVGGAAAGGGSVDADAGDACVVGSGVATGLVPL